MKIQKKSRTLFKYLLAIALSVFLAMASLLVSAFFPQWLIEENLWDSLPGLYEEGDYPVVSDHKKTSLLDNYSDILMLRASAATSSQYLGSVLTNPIYLYELPDHSGECDNIESLEKLIAGEQPDGVWNYVRYWMGFRVVLRFLLVFLDYFQIRRYLSVLFFALFAAVICSIAKQIHSKMAFAFAISIVLVRPQVIANSLQYCCCFLIAFCAMLLIPWLARNPKWEKVFFMEVGIVTMFFDFYTVPLIPFGLPLIYLYALRAKKESVPFPWVLKNLLAWLFGYAIMWLFKLSLTSALTSVNALYDGFQSFFGRMGIVKVEELEQFYDTSLAFEDIKKSIYSDAEGKVIYLTGAFAVVLAVVINTIRRKVPLQAFLAPRNLLFVAVLPLIWFFLTTQPIAIHYWFQYRSIALTHCAVGVYLCQVFEPRPEERAIAEGEQQ